MLKIADSTFLCLEDSISEVLPVAPEAVRKTANKAKKKKNAKKDTEHKKAKKDTEENMKKDPGNKIIKKNSDKNKRNAKETGNEMNSKGVIKPSKENLEQLTFFGKKSLKDKNQSVVHKKANRAAKQQNQQKVNKIKKRALYVEY